MSRIPWPLPLPVKENEDDDSGSHMLLTNHVTFGLISPGLPPHVFCCQLESPPLQSFRGLCKYGFV